MSRDNTQYYVQEPYNLDRGNGIWTSEQTLGCRINFVKAHIHSAIEILYFMTGTSLVVVDGVEYTANPGDMVLFRSNSIHEVYNISDISCTHFVLQLSPAQIFSFSSEQHGSSYLLKLSLNCKKEKCFWSEAECKKLGIDKLFQSLISEHNHENRFSDIRIKALSAQVLLSVLEAISDADSSTDEEDEAVSGCIYNAIVYINNHYNANITADICAKKVYMSYGHFSRSFKRATGANFKDYLNRIRVNHAEKALIGTNDTIAEICHNCGFNTVSYFIAMFRRIKGVTPAVYREKYRQASKESIDTEDKK